jgi:hypothetical protein
MSFSDRHVSVGRPGEFRRPFFTRLRLIVSSALSRFRTALTDEGLLLGKMVFGSIALARPRWKPSACIRLRSRGKTLCRTSTNEILMPLVPYEFRCAGMILCCCAYLRRRRCWWPRSGDEGPRGPGAENAGPGHRLRGRRRHGRSVRGGPTPLVQGRYFGTEGATILDTWPLPMCKVGSGRGRNRGGCV